MLQLEHFHFDTPTSDSDACQHCNYHSQPTVLEQAQESYEANLASYCREERRYESDGYMPARRSMDHDIGLHNVTI